MAHYFERKTGSQLWYSYLGIWQAFLQKKKKMDVASLSLQEKQLTSLINFKFSKLKLKFWKILSATTSLASCQYSKTFLVRLVGYY